MSNENFIQNHWSGQRSDLIPAGLIFKSTSASVPEGGVSSLRGFSFQGGNMSYMTRVD